MSIIPVWQVADRRLKPNYYGNVYVQMQWSSIQKGKLDVQYDLIYYVTCPKYPPQKFIYIYACYITVYYGIVQ